MYLSTSTVLDPNPGCQSELICGHTYNQQDSLTNMFADALALSSFEV